MTEQWEITRLKEHPKQVELFGDVDEEAFADLVQSLSKDGQKQPVDVLPDGEVLDGHQRLRAAMELGWSHLDVVVRPNLVEAGEAAIEKFMIDANLIRRQLDVLQIARLYRRLKEIERNRSYDDLRYGDREELRDRVARLLGNRSGRTLDRYERLLDTPRAVQNAYSRRELTAQLALKVADQNERLQWEIAQCIEAGEAPKDVVAELVPGASTNAPSPSKEYRKLLLLLDRKLDLLLENVNSIAGTALPSEQAFYILARAEEFFCDAAECERQIAVSQEQATEDVLDDFLTDDME